MMTRFLKRTLGGLLASLALWGGGLGCFVYDMTLLSPPLLSRQRDAIVVLTGGADRLKTGLLLLERGQAKALFLSGVHKGVSKKSLFIQASLPVELGYQATTTLENAQEAHAWLRAKKARSFFLVTAHYHMRRALLEFGQRLEEGEGIEMIPYPVTPTSFHLTPWWRRGPLALLVFNEYNKYILALCRAFVRWAVLTTGYTK